MSKQKANDGSALSGAAGPLILSHGSKGGVGKSFTSCMVLDYMLRHGVNVIPVDTDFANADLLKRYGEKSAHKQADVCTISLDNAEGLSTLIDTFDTHTGPTLVDLGAGAGDNLEKMVANYDLVSHLTERGIRVTMLFTISRSRPSLENLKDALEVFKDLPADWVVVKSLMYGAADRFKRYDAGQTRKRVQSIGGIEIGIPDLDDDLYDELDYARMPYSFALEPEGNLRTAYRLRLKGYMKAVDAELAKIRHLLGMPLSAGF